MRWLALVALVGCQDPSVPVAECPRCPPVQAAEPCPEPPKPPPDAAMNQPRTELAHLDDDFVVMRADDTDVYLFANVPGGDDASLMVAKLPVGGGTPKELARVPGAIQDALLDGDQLLVSSMLIHGEHLLHRIAKVDGKVTALASLPRGHDIDGIAADADATYYCVWRDPRKIEVHAISKSTGKDTVLYTWKNTVDVDRAALASSLGVDATHLYWGFSDGSHMRFVTLDKAKPGKPSKLTGWGCRDFRTLAVVGDRLLVTCGDIAGMWTAATLENVWMQTLPSDVTAAADDTLVVLASRIGGIDWLFEDKGIVATRDSSPTAVPTVRARDVVPYDVLVHRTGILVLTPDAVLRFER